MKWHLLLVRQSFLGSSPTCHACSKSGWGLTTRHMNALYVFIFIPLLFDTGSSRFGMEAISEIYLLLRGQQLLDTPILRLMLSGPRLRRGMATFDGETCMSVTCSCRQASLEAHWTHTSLFTNLQLFTADILGLFLVRDPGFCRLCLK